MSPAGSSDSTRAQEKRRGRRRWLILAGCLAVAVTLVFVYERRVPDLPPAGVDASLPRGPRPATVPAGMSNVVLSISIDVVPEDAVPHWTVKLWTKHGQPPTRTGRGSGKIEISVPQAGACRVLATAPGFVGETKKVEVRGDRTPCRLRLTRLGGIRGIVTAGEGMSPVRNAVVSTILPPGAMHGFLWMTPRDRRIRHLTRTGPDGSFALEGLPASANYTVKLYHPEYSPETVTGIQVNPGRTTRVPFRLARGVHLVGRLVDYSGATAAGERVCFLKVRGWGWDIEAETRTNQRGEFRSPALVPGVRHLVKVWMKRAGSDEIAQAVVTTPRKGTLDVGTVAPRGAMVTFVLTNAESGKRYCLVFGGNDPQEKGGEQPPARVVLAGVPFDENGRARVAGIPLGCEMGYSVLEGSVLDGTVGREVARGGVRVEGMSMTVTVEVKPPPSKEEDPKKKIRVELVARCPDPCEFFVFTEKGAVVTMMRARPSGVDWRAAWKLPVGGYVVYAFGDRLAGMVKTELKKGGAQVRLTLEQPLKEMRFRVVRKGKPVPGAQAHLVGWNMTGRKGGVPIALWGQADDQGRMVLKRIPLDVHSVRLAIIDKTGEGRGVEVREGRLEVDIGTKE